MLCTFNTYVSKELEEVYYLGRQFTPYFFTGSTRALCRCVFHQICFFIYNSWNAEINSDVNPMRLHCNMTIIEWPIMCEIWSSTRVNYWTHTVLPNSISNLIVRLNIKVGFMHNGSLGRIENVEPSNIRKRLNCHKNVHENICPCMTY